VADQRLNIRVGIIGKLVAPGYGDCGRCRTPWLFVRYHVTKYSNGSGCFPLCQKCWRELGTPEARLPYYRDLLARWHDPDGAKWCAVEAAVRAGG
jgi:hypothetical protein